MAEGYYNQSSDYLIGSSTETSDLTADYAGNTAELHIGGSGEIVLFITYTPAQSGRELRWKLQGSEDRQSFFQLPLLTEKATGDRQLLLLEDYFGESVVGGTAYKFLIPYQVNSEYFRISFKEDGSSNFGTLNVYFKVGGM